MAQEQNYQVNYTIHVDASQGTPQVIAFGEAVGKLVQAKASLAPAVKNISDMMQEIDKIFRTKNGKKRSYDYKLNIDTGSTEEKLGRVKTLLTEIGELSKGINLVINAGQPLESKSIKAKAQSLIDKKAVEARKAEIEKNAASSVTSVMETQKRITKVIGKVNAALASLQRGREVNIQTDVAKERLLEILSLLNRIKGASKMTLGLQMGSTGVPGMGNGGIVVPYSAEYRLPDKAQQRLQEKLYTSQQLHRQKLEQSDAEFESKMRQRSRLDAAKKAEKAERDAARAVERMQRQEAVAKQKAARDATRAAEQVRRKEAAARQKAEREAERQKRQTAVQSVRAVQRQQTAAGSLYRSKRRAAINRIQYSKAPSLRSLPFASMLNAYMGYSLMRSELTKAIDYSNIMESAHSILRVADSDLSTFETRFDEMGRRVRRIGVDTKFTAMEIAGAVKYLSMAGMNIETINKSIRPIVNLALIGDNDVSYIADLATNIMAGYDIRNESMNSVSDIIASTVSRSNVNIAEMAESYKMAAGYLRTAGVEFSEASAAIGLLGNMGMKGTLAGTSLRAMSTRFAKPTKEGQKVLDRLGIRFTEMRDIYGKQVERLRPIADIFQDFHDKGASMADMQSVFGKIAGNSAMLFIQNYDKLRELTSQNRASYGISSELALVKQETTKGLWSQVTSQLTESFMAGYEILEPVIRSTLHSLLEKFKAPEFSKGLVSIGQALLDIVKIVGNIGAWFTRNFHWIEPLLFTGIVSTQLFKLAGTLTNVGIALGFIGKQAAATSSLELIQGLVGLKGLGKLSFANKRAIVSALSSAGIAGRGAMRQALVSGGGLGTRGVLQSLFATQVATGNGLTGAAASLSAISTGAVAATAGISALVGALGWVAYKTWKIKEAKDAMQEELGRSEKYRYPSIDALYESLRKTYKQAVDTKDAVDNLTKPKTIEEASGQSTGIFTGNWWRSYFSMLGASQYHGLGANMNDIYTPSDAYQDDVRAAIKTIARRDSQSRINSAFAKLGKQSSAVEVQAFMKTIRESYGQADDSLDKSLWTTDKKGKIWYKTGLGEMEEAIAAKTFDYAQYQNTVTVPEIFRAAEVYLNALSTQSGAQTFMRTGGFDFDYLREKGFSQDKEGYWRQKALGAKATDEERSDQLANRQLVQDALIRFLASARHTLGGSAEAAENILKKAGFTSDLYTNEPGNNNLEPYNANRITNSGDDGGAGGNYSGTGKLSSAAPKQVIVNISNLMSIGTIDLLKSPEGQLSEIQNLKEQLAQALIDTVHDFDASWNA
jgi:TP901 family phage tail tape measure protein